MRRFESIGSNFDLDFFRLNADFTQHSLRYRRAPFVRAHIPRVPREKPVMAIEVLDPILPLAIFGLMQVLDNMGAGLLRSPEMAIHILDEHGQALGSIAQLRRAALTRWGLSYHDPRVTQMNLRTGRRGWIAIPVVFDKAERSGQPGDRLFKVLINNVGEHGAGRNGAIG